MSQYYVIIRAEYYNPEENDARFWKLADIWFSYDIRRILIQIEEVLRS
jgi:hypothetical protein